MHKANYDTNPCKTLNAKVHLSCMQLTSLTVGNIVIMEPVTVLTDLLIAAICFYGWYKLKKHHFKEHRVVRLYRGFLLTMGLATAYGGIMGHALQHYFGFAWKVPGWYISMLSVALAERGAIMHARPYLKEKIGDFLAFFNVFELVAFMVAAGITLKFIYVEVHAVYGMLLVVFSFETYVYVKVKDQGSKNIMIAIVFAFLAMVVHLTHLTIDVYFNHLDLSHCLMAVSIWYIVRGLSRMHFETKAVYTRK